MKTLIHGSIVLCLFMAISGCNKDKNNSPSNAKGTITISIETDIRVHDLPHNFKAAMASADSFSIDIYNTAGEVVVHHDYAIDMPETIELEDGEYYVEAYFGRETDVGFEQPYLSGQSDLISVIAGEHQQVSITCDVQNSAVSIVYSQNITDQFDTYSTQVSTSESTLTFNETETRYGYFPLTPITFVCTLTYETLSGTQEKTLHGEIPDPLPGKLYEVRLDATVENGELAIQIVPDESLETEIIEVGEHNPLMGALVITEIMYNPDSMSDTYGEWFEVYNATDSAININDFVIRRDQNSHVIDLDETLEPGMSYAFAKTDSAVTGAKYVYGTGINLTNSSGTLGIYTYGTDGTNGREVCEVIYEDGGSFPSGEAGVAIQLSADSLQNDIAKLGSNWCHATTAYGTGDLGTPGEANGLCVE